MKTFSNFSMNMFCNNNRVSWVIFHFIKIFHSKLLSSCPQTFLAHVVFAVANNSAVLIQLSIANNQNIFLVSCSVLAICKILGFIFVISMSCISSNSVKKYSDIDLRASAKLYRPQTIDFSECEKTYPFSKAHSASLGYLCLYRPSFLRLISLAI